jgi:hypothetical protein
MSKDEIAFLRATQTANVEHFCCFIGGTQKNGVSIKDMMTGFARIITYSPNNGMESLEEGHFTRGK